MKVTCFGSCRLNPMKSEEISTDFLDVNLTYSAKDIIQMIKWIKGDIQISENIFSCICHSAMWCKANVLNLDNLKNIFVNTDIFILEISSLKSYKYENFYCHLDILNCKTKDLFKHIPKKIYENVVMVKDDEKDLEKDLLEIIQLIGNRKLIIVTHILSSFHFSSNKERKKLIDSLDNLCKKYNIDILFPGDILTRENIENIILPDYQHYTLEGITEIKKFYHDKIKSFLKVLKI